MSTYSSKPPPQPTSICQEVPDESGDRCGCMHYGYQHSATGPGLVELVMPSGMGEKRVWVDRRSPCTLLSCDCTNFEPDNLTYMARKATTGR